MPGGEGLGDGVEVDRDLVLAPRLEPLGVLVALAVRQVEDLLADDVRDAVRADVVEPDGDQSERPVAGSRSTARGWPSISTRSARGAEVQVSDCPSAAR